MDTATKNVLEIRERAIQDHLQKIERLRLALEKLANEVSGCLSAFEYELRQAIGNTNYACLELRRDEARAALAQEQLAMPDHEPGFSNDGLSRSAAALADKIAGYAKVRLCRKPDGGPHYEDFLVHEQDRYLICKALRAIGQGK